VARKKKRSPLSKRGEDGNCGNKRELGLAKGTVLSVLEKKSFAGLGFRLRRGPYFPDVDSFEFSGLAFRGDLSLRLDAVWRKGDTVSYHYGEVGLS